MGIRYVTNADRKGWLVARYTDDSTYPPLPQFLKVDHQNTSDGRDHFVISEGRNKGKTASVSLKPANTSYLSSTPPPHARQALVKFNITTEQLWYGNSDPVPAKNNA